MWSRSEWVAPDDGCSWIQAGDVVQAQLVVPGGPADRAGIRVGDILLQIDGRPIESDRSVTEILYDIGPKSQATYSIQRAGTLLNATLVIAGAPPHLTRPRFYLEIVGLFYFLAGTLVLIQRSRAPQAVHFHFVCLASFVMLVYSYTGELNTFDWMIFWLDLGASALLPPLFLHCLGFPLRKNWQIRNKKILVLLYLPGMILLMTWLLFVYGILQFIPSPLVFRNFLKQPATCISVLTLF
jgi:hypothetical protein